jgi:2-methylcitrate dehydratase PrpD
MNAGSHDRGVTACLSAFVARTRWEDLDRGVRHEAKRSLVNYFACALGGCRDPVIDKTLSVLGSSGSTRASVVGRTEQPNAWDAAFVNAASANVFDFDDTHTPTIVHPTAPVAPPLFAQAESSLLSGRDLLLAFAVGVEVECRLAVAVTPWHYRRGFHITSTCGIFGAAAAMSKVLQLDPQQVAWALGNASASASGLVETLGTMSKSLGVGGAARNGWLAAVFAREGISGPASPLEGPRGLLKVMGEDADESSIVDGLGERWELLANTYKLYPCGIVLSPVIEACLAIRGMEGFAARGIDTIVVTGHPLLAERTDRPNVDTGRQSQVSAQHAVAAALLRGRAGLAEFSDDCVRDPAIRALQSRVQVAQDGAYRVESVRVDVHMRDGRTHSETVECAVGSVERPLSDRGLENKLRVLAEHGRFEGNTSRLIDRLWSLDDVADAGEVMRIAAGRTAK